MSISLSIVTSGRQHLYAVINWLISWLTGAFVWKALPAQQLPEVFGMHDNVDISKELQETKLLFDNVLLTQGRSEGGGGGKSDDVLYQVANNILVKVLQWLWFLLALK